MEEYGLLNESLMDMNVGEQREQYTQFGINSEHMIDDWYKLLKTLKPRDTVVMASLECLSRSTQEIEARWRLLTEKCCVELVVLNIPALDTRSFPEAKNMVRGLIQYILKLQTYYRKKVQAQGIAAAQEIGVHFGRRRGKLPPNYYEVKRQWENGAISGKEAADALGLLKSTFFRWVKEYQR